MTQISTIEWEIDDDGRLTNIRGSKFIDGPFHKLFVLLMALFRHVTGPTNVRFEMQRGPDRQDEADDHTLNDLETIRSFNHAR